MAGFPPGPRGLALVQGAGLSRDPLGWIERQRSRYGNVFSARFPYFGRVVYLAHPDAVKEAFTGSPALMHAGEANAGPLGAVLGTYSLLTLDDEPHMEQRKLLLPPFHGDNVRLYGEVMAEAAAREVETWSVGEQIQLREATQRITLEVILRAVFGVREEDRRREFERRILPLSGVSNMLIWMPFLRRVPFLVRRSERVIEAIDELIYEEIAERRAAPDAEERGDVLSLLLSARHEDGSPMSDQELRDELMTLLGAGHETTATGLAWAFERLLRDARRAGAADLRPRRRRVPRRRGQGDAARPPGRDRLRAQAHRGLHDRRLRPPRRHAAAAGDRPAQPASRPVAGAGGVPARALPGGPAGSLQLDPVRRRRAPLHRRRVRPAGDEDRAARDPRARATTCGRPRTRATPGPPRDDRPGPRSAGGGRGEARAATGSDAGRGRTAAPRSASPQQTSRMPNREKLLVLFTVVGFVVPNAMVVVFLAEHGFEPGHYLGDAVETLPSAQLTMDLVIAALAFVAWTAWDGPRTGVRRWWVTIPASLLVGLCFALPLYLLLRERRVTAMAGPTRTGP